jgi:hypothetical protein
MKHNAPLSLTDLLRQVNAHDEKKEARKVRQIAKKNKDLPEQVRRDLRVEYYARQWAEQACK